MIHRDIQGAIVSNQIYIETYSCVSLRLHPMKNYFAAQSAGNYIALFSAKMPYNLNKHKVSHDPTLFVFIYVGG